MSMDTREVSFAIILAVLIFPVVHATLSRKAARREGRQLHYRGYSRIGDMKQLGIALLSYSGDNDGEFPDSLWRLPDGDYISAGYVASPVDVESEPVPRFSTSIELEDMGIYHRYHYFGNGLRADDPDSTTQPLLVYPYQNGGSKHVSILYVDGHVEGLWCLSHDDVLEIIDRTGER